MKKLLTIILALVLLFSVGGTVLADGEAPVIKKPIHGTVYDESGTPVSGATVQVLNNEGTVIQTCASDGNTFTAFLEEGEYTFRISEAPSGYIADEDVQVTVTVEEAELAVDLVGNCTKNYDYVEICSGNPKHAGIELYEVQDGDETVIAYCFNESYDNPYGYDGYRRLVGTPEDLYNLAQNKDPNITPQELYDHVLGIIYHSAEVQQQYELDDVIIRFLVGRAIKSFTDPTKFVSFDDDGNSLLMRDENGVPIKDENGNYMFYPGGTVLGSAVNHSKGHGQVFPQRYKDAYHDLIAYTDHPSDYFLYLYYPANFENANIDTYQCLMSVFTVKPTRTQMAVRTATQCSITKQWVDGNDEDGLRPAADAYAALIRLYAGEQDVTADYTAKRSVTDNGDGTYTVSFSDLPKLDANGQEIAYLIKEDSVSGYLSDKTEAADGETITNTQVREIEVKKIWDDQDNADGSRPTEITIHLLADDQEIDSVTLKKANEWKHSFTDLPVWNGENKIVYSITEDPVEGYESVVDGFTVTNTHVPETTVEETTEAEETTTAGQTTPPTGDENALPVLAVTLMVSVLSFTVLLRRRRESD